MIIFLMSQSDLLIIRGVLSKGGTPALCLYPPLTQTLKYSIMGVHVKYGKPADTPEHGDNYIDRTNGQVPDDIKGTIYESQFLNNPYRYLYYDPSTWDHIGLSNKSKDANLNYEKLYNEHVAGIYDQMRQDEYNSESAKSARMRQAGQNPDLLGLAGASSTDEMNPNHTPADPALNGQSPAISGFQLMTSVLGFATSTYQQLESIYGTSLDNTSKELGLFDNMLPDAERSIINEYASRFLGKERDWQDVKSDVNYGNRRANRKYSQAFDYFLKSSKFSAAESAYSSLSKKDKATKIFMDGIIGLEVESMKHGFNASISLSKFNKDYYDNADGKGKADSEKRDRWLNKWRNDFYKSLYEEFDKHDNLLAGLYLIGIQPTLGKALQFRTSQFGKKLYDLSFGENGSWTFQW